MLSAKENEFITRTGPGTPMGRLFRRFWIPALLATELPAPDCPPVRVRLLGEDLVAFKDSDGRIGLLDAHCPHRLADLFFGRNEECGLRCVYHGWKFDVDGACVDMPNEPAESNFKTKIRTTAYPCREAGGLIWTYMGPPELLPDFPQYEFTLVPEDQRIVGKVQVDCNYLQGMEGECDNSHVGFLHRLLAGGLPPMPKQRLQKHSLSPYLGRDTAPKGIVTQTDYGIRFAWRRTVDEEHFHYHINQWLMPFQTMIATPPGETIMTIIRPPRDDVTSWSFVVHWNPARPLSVEEHAWFREGGLHMVQLIPGTFKPRANMENNFFQDRSLQRSYSYTGIPTPIYNQDFAATIGMGPIVDRTKEHLGTADAVLIAVRRRLKTLAEALQQGIEPYPTRHGEVYGVRPVDVLLPREASVEEGAREFLIATVGGAKAAG